MTTLRMLLGGLIFAQTIRWAWAWWRARRPETVRGSADRFSWAALLDLLLIGAGRLVRPTYAALPWDPAARIRVRPLTPAETRAAVALERALAD